MSLRGRLQGQKNVGIDAQKSPAERARLGAHYTPQSLCDIVVSHTLAIPLWQDWHTAKQAGHETMLAFAGRVKALRVLDPACGDGALLRAADRAINTIDLVVSQKLGTPRRAPMAGMLGIDIDAPAVRAARGYGIDTHLGYALAVDWPACDFIVANPPFLGGSKFRRALGDAQAIATWRLSPGIPMRADLAMHFWCRGAAITSTNPHMRMGYIMPNSYAAGGANQRAAAPYFTGANELGIRFAAKDIAWPGAAQVHVCIIVCSAGPCMGWLANAA